MATKKSATWDAATTGCSYYIAVPIGIALIFTALFFTGGLITGLVLLLNHWFTGWHTPLSALITVGIFFALFALMLPTIAPILRVTSNLQKRYRKARERLHHIHDEKARVERLMAEESPENVVDLPDEIIYYHNQET